jgi:hypothetical protein
MNVLSRAEQLSVLSLLVEGNCLRSVTRLTGVHRTTAMKLMLRAGERCRALLGRWMQNLTLGHLEIDEIWTFVLKKQGRIPVDADDSRIGDQYLFLAVDQGTKLIPCFAVAKRNKEITDRFVEDLAERLVLPELFGPGPRPQLSTDGWAAYPDSIEMASRAGAATAYLSRTTAMPTRLAATGRPKW